MKTNTVSHLLMNVNRSATIETGEHTISNSYCEKLLGVKIDIQLNFNNYLETIIKKESGGTCTCICISKRKLLMNTFSRFNLATVHLYGCAIVV